MVAQPAPPVAPKLPKPRNERIYGKTVPRKYTLPLVTGPVGECPCGACALTEETSYGFRVIRFARDVLLEPLDPWQRFLVIHLGELLADGRPRFRQVLVIVARQNGKTHLLRVLTLYWMFVQQWDEILGTSKDRNGAKNQLEKVYGYITRIPELNQFMPKTGNRGYTKVTGTEALTTTEGSRYAIGAPNSSAGRGDSLDRWVCDELRQHRNRETYSGAIYAMNARPHAQAVFITNQGGESAVVLHELRDQATDMIEGRTEPDDEKFDDSLGLFEWSAPEDCDIMDPDAWASANPNLGRRLPVSVIRSQAIAATRSAEKLVEVKTEVLCIRVKILDGAVDPIAWGECYEAGQLDPSKDRIAFGVDVSLDGLHVTLMGAAVQADGRTRVEQMKSWTGADAVQKFRSALPAIVDKMKPKSIGWLPYGPAAVLDAVLKDRTKRGRYGWPPPGVTIEPIGAEAKAVCMGFSNLVSTREIIQNDDELVTDHVTSVSKKWTGDAWVFGRDPKIGYSDAAYAAAIAVHGARTLPTEIPDGFFVDGEDDDE